MTTYLSSQQCRKTIRKLYKERPRSQTSSLPFSFNFLFPSRPSSPTAYLPTSSSLFHSLYPPTKTIPQQPSIMSNIISACVHNAGRSQMAASFFNKHKTHPLIKGISTGTNLDSEVQPVVREIMMEIGIDLSNITPVKLTTELAQTVSTNKSVEEARVIRDANEQRIEDFITENNY